MNRRALREAVMNMEFFMFGGTITREHTFSAGGGDFVTPETREWPEDGTAVVRPDEKVPRYVRIVNQPGTTPRVRYEYRA